jgi:hypothetical protein
MSTNNLRLNTRPGHEDSAAVSAALAELSKQAEETARMVEAYKRILARQKKYREKHREKIREADQARRARRKAESS